MFVMADLMQVKLFLRSQLVRLKPMSKAVPSKQNLIWIGCPSHLPISKESRR